MRSRRSVVPAGQRRHGRTATRQRGAVLVEFALVFPLLAMMLLGIVTSGRAYNQKLDVTHATREGARYGASVSPAQLWSTGTWASNVRDLAVARSSGDLTSAQVCVALVQSTSATTSAVYSGSGYPATYYTTNADGSPCFADTYPQYGTNDTGLRVQVSASRPSAIELVVLPPIDLTLSSTASAKAETNT